MMLNEIGVTDAPAKKIEGFRKMTPCMFSPFGTY